MVSTVPAEIAGIGSTQQRLRVSPGFDPLKAQVGPEEYFVLSRIDGVQTLREVLLATGLPVDRAIAIITRLRSIGALLLPGESAAPSPVTPPRIDGQHRPMPARHPTEPGRKPLPHAPVGVQHTPAPPPAPPQEMVVGHDLSLPNPTADELAALSEVNDLDDTDRRRILAIARLIERNDPFALLGCRVGADAKDLKRAYFQLSKDIHPDRYYGKRLG